MMKITVVTIAVLLGVLRVYFGFTVPPESPTAINVFKDLAHVFIGVIGCKWWPEGWNPRQWEWGWVFWGLTALEVFVATLTRI